MDVLMGLKVCLYRSRPATDADMFVNLIIMYWMWVKSVCKRENGEMV